MDNDSQPMPVLANILIWTWGSQRERESRLVEVDRRVHSKSNKHHVVVFSIWSALVVGPSWVLDYGHGLTNDKSIINDWTVKRML